MRPAYRKLTPQQLTERIGSLELQIARMTDQLRQAETRASLAEASCREAWKTARALAWSGRPSQNARDASAGASLRASSDERSSGRGTGPGQGR